MLSNILTKFYLFFEGTENDNVTRVLTSSAVNNAVSQHFLADSVRLGTRKLLHCPVYPNVQFPIPNCLKEPLLNQLYGHLSTD